MWSEKNKMGWLYRQGIAFKLSLLVLSGVTLVISVILALNYRVSRHLMTEKIEENAFNLAQATANRINTTLKSVEKIPAGLAQTINELQPDNQELNKLLADRLAHNPELFGIAVAFAPETDVSGTKLNSCYYINAFGRIKKSPITYDYQTHDWYQVPQVLGRPVWSEPYYGESGHNTMTTYSVPFYKQKAGHREFAGIVSVDLSLNWLRNIVLSLKIGKTGYAFLITHNGTFVTHPDIDLIMNETIFSVAEAQKRPEIRTIGRHMIAGEKGFTAFNGLVSKHRYWMAYTPLPANGWSLGVLFPQNELMAEIYSLTKSMIILGICGFFMIMMIILLIAGRITKPLRSLAASAEQIAMGNLETTIQIPESRDEVGRLAISFAGMQQSLKEYINDLTATTAAKERIESELNIASEIQMGVLPKIFPPFPNRPEFNLYASIRPAREVGGDLYDFFMIDDQHLCFTVGDVSGKGVPAALFMTITQTLIKTRIGLSASHTLHQVNNDLSHDNPSMMFVTLFLGILNIVTGELEYCNAGHNPPYLISSDLDSVQPLATTDGIALGIMEDYFFSTHHITMTSGETLFLFTDGVTEAMNSKAELFSETRLEKRLKGLGREPVDRINKLVTQEIEDFTSGALQTDDITILVIRYLGT